MEARAERISLPNLQLLYCKKTALTKLSSSIESENKAKNYLNLTKILQNMILLGSKSLRRITILNVRGSISEELVLRDQ